jgi:hypothetical protein
VSACRYEPAQVYLSFYTERHARHHRYTSQTYLTTVCTTKNCERVLEVRYSVGPSTATVNIKLRMRP